MNPKTRTDNETDFWMYEGDRVVCVKLTVEMERGQTCSTVETVLTKTLCMSEKNSKLKFERYLNYSYDEVENKLYT